MRLPERFRSNALLALGSRIRYRRILEPYSTEKLGEYMDHALEQAGAPQLMTRPLINTLESEGSSSDGSNLCLTLIESSTYLLKRLLSSSALQQLSNLLLSRPVAKGCVEAVYADEHIWPTLKMMGILHKIGGPPRITTFFLRLPRSKSILANSSSWVFASVVPTKLGICPS